jgi:hypothetical protein
VGESIAQKVGQHFHMLIIMADGEARVTVTELLENWGLTQLTETFAGKILISILIILLIESIEHKTFVKGRHV